MKLIPVILLVIFLWAPAAEAAPAKWKPCERIGQKHCKEIQPGYSGRCVKSFNPGLYVILYKSYPKKLYRIICYTKY